MKTQLKKFAVLKTIFSKIGAYLHKIDAVPQEDESDFDDEEWMDHPTKPSLAHVILDLLLSPTYRLPKTVTHLSRWKHLLCLSKVRCLHRARIPRVLPSMWAIP